MAKKKTPAKAKRDRKPKKHPGGRPLKINETIVQKLVEGFKDDFTVEEACRYAGISKVTFYAECKRDPAFANEMDRAQDYPLVLAKKRMLQYINSPREGFGTLALKFLERRQKDRYTPKMTLEHEGGVTIGYAELEGKKPKTLEEARNAAEEEDEEWGE